MPFTLKPSQKLDLHLSDSLTSQLVTDKFNLSRNFVGCICLRYRINFISVQIETTINNFVMRLNNRLHRYEFWTSNFQETFNLKSNIPRKIAIDLHTDVSHPYFKFILKKPVHHEAKNIFGKTLLPI